VPAQPGQKLEIERIAILRFVHDHFVEARRNGTAKTCRPIAILQPGHGFDACISRA
jgi:hypothetical protein